MSRRNRQHITRGRTWCLAVLTCFIFTLFYTTNRGTSWSENMGELDLLELLEQTAESESSSGKEVKVLDDYHVFCGLLLRHLLHEDIELSYLAVSVPLPSFPHLSRNIPPPELDLFS